MKVEVQVGKRWRPAEATIDDNGHAHVHLPYPYGYRTFKVWRKPAKRKSKKAQVAA